MAKYLSNIDLTNNQLQNAALHPTGTAPSSPVEGQVYFNTTSNKLFVHDGSNWVDVSGDITSITAGTGLTGTASTGDVTLSLDTSGVTAASYGSSTAIPVLTIDQYGRVTSASTANITTSWTISDGSTTQQIAGGDTLIVQGTANEVDVAVTATDTLTIGLPNDVTIGNNLTVTGNLTVSGTTTTVNTETINLADNIITLNSNATGSASEDAGIEVERGDDTNVSILWDESATAWTFTNDGSTYYNVPTPTNIASSITAREYVASIGDGSTTSFTVTHNLGSRDVIVQLFDNSTYDTVYADVERTTTNTLTVAFAAAPSSNDIRVLVTKIG
jgi:hypothetical protein